MVISFAWYPFALSGFTEAQTAKIINDGLAIISNLANVQFTYSPTPDFTISGSASNSWAAATLENHIWFGLGRKTTAKWWTFNAAPHEFCHLWGSPKFLAWGHTSPAATKCLMHPNGSRDYFMCPTEVQRIVAKYGRPQKPYWPIPPLKVQGDIIRKNQPNKDKYYAEWEKWSKLRDQTSGPDHQAYAKKAKDAHNQFMKYYTPWLVAVREYQSLYKSWKPALDAMAGKGFTALAANPHTFLEPHLCYVDLNHLTANKASLAHSEHQTLRDMKDSLNPKDLRPCE